MTVRLRKAFKLADKVGVPSLTQCHRWMVPPRPHYLGVNRIQREITTQFMISERLTIDHLPRTAVVLTMLRWLANFIASCHMKSCPSSNDILDTLATSF